jgi:hypothetical protein
VLLAVCRVVGSRGVQLFGQDDKYVQLCDVPEQLCGLLVGLEPVEKLFLFKERSQGDGRVLS